MDLGAADLPDDVETLRAMILAARARAAAAEAEIEQIRAGQAQLAAVENEHAQLLAQVAQLEAQNERYALIIAKLRRLQFGKRSEQLDKDQLQLAFEDLVQGLAEIEQEEERSDPELKAHRTRQRRDRRPSLPDHLPQIDVTIEPETRACSCCGGELHVIGEDVSKRLDVVPAQYQVIVTRRPKYACRSCEGPIVQAPAPARLIEGGLPTERLVTQVVVDKYADHVPLYRQAQGFARQGISLDRSTLAFWTGYAAAELKPIWAHMRQTLLSASRLFVDETKAPVLDPGRGRTKSGYFWAIARDDRGWAGTDPPAVVYTYAPGRGADHAITLLKDFSGVLQTDGYTAYKTLATRRNDVALAHCWSHARRKAFDLTKGGSAPVAGELLARIGQLYAVEAEIRGQSAEARRQVRRQRSAPLIAALKSWLEEQLTRLPGRSQTAEAIRYIQTHWDGLTLFLDDGRIELDTNPVERTMRPIALNRKNALFAGSDEGAEHWAILATLIECCKLHGVNPAAYLEDVLTRLVNGHLNSRLDDLTPWNWKAAQAAA
ncbi:IS66 family transposase [Phenylobacterium sp. J426]|uniref:IS66 family transposase n=1 Tax=Phenylobacterium sp. J426 TaxID=2898439 RepID=UPI002151F208|nr:IS66 family transposase [Phenylobacterium sp. J426]MCR5875888.1 IS66 family transposase [Phenylobacterium sp. J426]